MGRVQLDSEWVIGHAFDVIIVTFNSMFGAYRMPDMMRDDSSVLICFHTVVLER